MQEKARRSGAKCTGTATGSTGLIDMAKVSLTLARGARVLDGLLENGIAIGYDCGGTLACASCRVVVLQGGEHLAPPSEDELDMLDRSCAPADARLACQATAAGGALMLEVGPQPTAAAGATSPIGVTQRAAAHFRAQLAKEPGAIAVRLSVAPSGCSGFGYQVDSAAAIRDGDTVFEANGVRIVVDRASLPYVHGSTLDVVQEGLARRLRFDNPNALQTCGCGESFAT